ncbi:MAG: 23S rRNA (guanosine(2251)-2'-O)-methyltransferase RlmB [Oscillospiraceae bacterium]|nr:23S rRNA (guanosine(2251)-2'-O)-methyltransferase RlmB [Oscillospiraceae bacterium]
MPYKDDRTRKGGKDYRSPESDDSFVIGRNPVKELLRSGKSVDTVYMDTALGGSLSQISRLAKEAGVVVKDVKSDKLSRMCGSDAHQGVIAAAACAEYVSVEDILAVSAEKGTSPFIIICDEIEDPHNLGAIIRTAEAAGADGIIIPKRRSASLNMTVHRTSAGAASFLPVARVSNIPQTIDMLKERGIWIYGTQADAPSYTDTDLTGACAVVIGSEGFGMSRLVREKCDVLVSLPMLGKINSLNASVAAGIFIYEALRQRMIKARKN